ncbi:asparagine synthetase B family protein [Gordonia hirsuta]|nr:asparagine synthase-related protein [Gordonia hirsuta]
MAAIAGRGETDERYSGVGLVAGTQRLKIVDREHAQQPWRSQDGRWLLCYNGEVFNHAELRAELHARGHHFRSESDTEVILAAFSAWGLDAVHHLRGEFAFTIVDLGSGEVYLARDPIGVKPLYYSWRHGRIHIASEVKALTGVGARIFEVPPGHHGLAAGTAGPVLLPYFDLLDGRQNSEPIDDPDEAATLIRSILDDAIAVRVDTDLPVGVVLSGGLDSSAVLSRVHQHHPDCVAFTIGRPGSDDLDYARRLTADLGVRHEIIDLRPRQIGFPEIRRAVALSELTEYGDVINAVVSIPLFERIRECGIKVVLTGDGSDELFGGYPMYHTIDADQADRLFVHKLQNLGRTELQRVDRSSMGQGVETRIPFLDKEMLHLAMRIPLWLKTAGEQEKWLVRRAFADALPDYILQRPKAGMSYSSGLHDRARLFRPLFAGIYRRLDYDLHEPMRRDFDSVLEAAGNDLDRAIASAVRRPDYRFGERARDLAGAVRWNIQSALTGKVG